MTRLDFPGLAFAASRIRRDAPGFSAQKWTVGSFRYNFIKIHRTLRTPSAVAAGVTHRLWSEENLVALWEPTNSGGRKEQRK
jgi:hypothetical protein